MPWYGTAAVVALAFFIGYCFGFEKGRWGQ